MARTRINGKEVDYHKREAYKIRKRQSKIERKNKDGALLNRLQLELRNRTIKQTRRWIQHVIESPNRGGMTLKIEQELHAYLSKPHSQKTKLSLKPALSRQADEFWRAFQDQRKAAMTAQGQPFEAVDWWVPKSGGNGDGEEARKEKLRKTIQSLNARMKELGEEGEMGQMGDSGVDGEEDEPEFEGLDPPELLDADGEEDELGFKASGPPELLAANGEEDDPAPEALGSPEPVTSYDNAPNKVQDEDEDEGGVQLAGSHSPIMLSPVLSPAFEEEEELPAFGPSRDLVLPFRSRP